MPRPATAAALETTPALCKTTLASPVSFTITLASPVSCTTTRGSSSATRSCCGATSFITTGGGPGVPATSAGAIRSIVKRGSIAPVSCQSLERSLPLQRRPMRRRQLQRRPYRTAGASSRPGSRTETRCSATCAPTRPRSPLGGRANSRPSSKLKYEVRHRHDCETPARAGVLSLCPIAGATISAKQVVLHDTIKRAHAVLPVDLLALGIGAPVIRDADLVDPTFGFGDL